jgi:hypothetical protein
MYEMSLIYSPAEFLTSKKGLLPLKERKRAFFFFDYVRAFTGSGRASPKFPVVEGILSRVEGIWRNVKSKDNGENGDYILTTAKKN